MTLEEIKSKIEPYLQAAQSGAEIENPKLDIKREWYKLNDIDGKAEFLIDVCSIVNTLGLDGFIIIGFDPKENKFYPASIKDSGLKDSSEIIGLISKHVDSIFTVNLFDFEYFGNKISVIHIPVSNNIPHVIRNCPRSKGEIKQATYLRKSSGKHLASKYDIDVMYLYRGSIVPEYLIHTSFHIDSLNLHQYGDSKEFNFKTYVVLNFENVGKRPASIHGVEIIFFVDPEDRLSPEIYFNYHENPIIVQPGQIITKHLSTHGVLTQGHFNHQEIIESRFFVSKNKKRIITKNCKLYLASGVVLESQLHISGLLEPLKFQG